MRACVCACVRVCSCMHAFNHLIIVCVCFIEPSNHSPMKQTQTCTRSTIFYNPTHTKTVNKGPPLSLSLSLSLSPHPTAPTHAESASSLRDRTGRLFRGTACDWLTGTPCWRSDWSDGYNSPSAHGLGSARRGCRPQYFSPGSSGLSGSQWEEAPR